MTLIISLISQKGGVGKSTLARSIATVAATDGAKVFLVDTDYNQQTSVKWGKRRTEHNWQPAINVKAFKDYNEALKHSDDYDIIIIDTKGYTDSETVALAKISDLIIHPCGLSLDDKEPTFITCNTLVANGILKESLLIVLIGEHTAPLEKEARKYFEAGDYKVAKGFLQKKAVYTKAINDGLSVTEASHPKSRDEAKELLESIHEELKRVVL